MAAGMRILVADDDPSMRRALKRLLDAMGFETIVFDSAEAVLRSDQSDGADCVVTDIHMPVTSGFELVDQLRARLGRMPAVFITAFDSASMRREAARWPSAAYLTKPFEAEALREAIREVTASGP